MEIEKRVREKREFRLKHPEEYERQRKAKLEIEKQKNRECRERVKKMIEKLTPDDVLRIHGSK